MHMNFRRISVSAILIAFLIIPFIKCGYANSDGPTQLNEAALLLAGKDLPKKSKLYSYTESTFYKSYRQQMEVAWNKFQKPNLQKIREWWQKYSPPEYPKTILYPFSGPDIMNALTFFPEADTYFMFGLEAPGVIPAPQAMSAEQITKGLNGVKRSLGDILQMNFFKTVGMAAELSNKSFNGIAGLIMYFLATNGYTVLDASKVTIDAAGVLVPGTQQDDLINWQNPPRSRVPGVEISFRKGQGKIQKARYFMLNVIDNALTSSSPNFIPYLKKQGPFAVIIKSASYLMHNDKEKFTRIRAALLETTGYFVQDDSGIPLRYFKQNEWKLGFHGYYNGPISLFYNRMQSDLIKAMEAKSSGKLPFSYGYVYKPGLSNLMTAERMK